MFCAKCGVDLGQVDPKEKFCPSCNTPISSEHETNTKVTVVLKRSPSNGFGIASLIFGIIGIFIFSPIFVPLAVLFGILALVKKQLAFGIVGLICAAIGFFTSPILMGWLALMSVGTLITTEVASEKHKISQATYNQRQTKITLINKNCWPQDFYLNHQRFVTIPAKTSQAFIVHPGTYTIKICNVNSSDCVDHASVTWAEGTTRYTIYSHPSCTDTTALNPITPSDKPKEIEQGENESDCNECRGGKTQEEKLRAEATKDRVKSNVVTLGSTYVTESFSPDRPETKTVVERKVIAKDNKANADQAEINKYKEMIRRKVKNAWVAPPGSSGSACNVRLRLTSDGTIIDANVNCNGNEIVSRSVENAIERSSPLPVPRDRNLVRAFRSITFTFNAN